jgi:DNA-binding transcriptional LysR family regulator
MHNPLDTRQLANFCEIANVGSIRKAAKNLNLTTSAVSHSLKRLEEDLSCKLFIRDTRKIELTYAGHRLRSYADELLGNLTKARYLVNEWNEISHQTLRIGATTAACQYIIPIALRELKESFPGINIQIVTGSSYHLIECMDDGKIDVSIYPSGSMDHTRNKSSIGTDSLQFIVNPMHEWAQSNKANLHNIESERIILTATKDYTFDLVNEYFRSYSVSLMPFIEISNEEVIKRLVELDIGIGILPHWIIKNEIQAGTLNAIPLGRRQLKRNWVVASHSRGEPSFAESLFAGITTSVAQSLFSDLIF